jgi:hypothetical protein
MFFFFHWFFFLSSKRGSVLRDELWMLRSIDATFTLSTLWFVFVYMCKIKIVSCFVFEWY